MAREIALRKLSARACSRYELERALQAKRVPEPVASRVLQRFEEVGLVDDAAFAAAWVESRQSRRRLSRAALRQELQVKGIGRDDIETALEGVHADDEVSAARALVAKKLRSTEGLEPHVRYRRLSGMLGRRGFGAAAISSVLEELRTR